MDDALQEGAGGQHHRAGSVDIAAGPDHADHPAALDHQVLNRLGAEREVRLAVQGGAHGGPVKLAIDLSAWAAHRRAARAVEHAELDAGLVGRTTDQAIERIHLPHQMTLAQPADRGVARHFADGFQLVGQQKCVGAKARGGGGGLATRVAGPDHDDVPHPGHEVISKTNAAGPIRRRQGATLYPTAAHGSSAGPGCFT